MSRATTKAALHKTGGLKQRVRRAQSDLAAAESYSTGVIRPHSLHSSSSRVTKRRGPGRRRQKRIISALAAGLVAEIYSLASDDVLPH